MPLHIRDKVALDDNDIWFHLKQWAHSEDQVLSNLCNDFLRRGFFKVFRVDDKVYQNLEKLDSPEFGCHLSTLVSLRMGCKPEEACIFYHFDAPQFNAVGRAPENPLETVWLMREGKYGHWFESLHQYWQDHYPQHETLDRKYFSLIVHPNCVNDVKRLIDRVSLECSPVEHTFDPPKPYKILGALGKEGAHKTAFLGASAEPGSAQNSIVALKRYKAVNPEAVRRDVAAINLLISTPTKHLSFASSMISSAQEFWVVERLWVSSLHDLVREDGSPRDLLEIAVIGHHLFRGLSTLHENNIRHTDLKPDNCGFVLNDSGKRIYVIGDFGCASTSPEEIPTDNSLLGRFRTRAPETFQLPPAISLKSDVWALATTIAAIVLEKYPFMSLEEPRWQAHERLEKESRIRENLPSIIASYIQEARNSLPPALFALLHCCWQPDVARATAKEMADKFRSLVRKLEENHDVDAIRHAWKRAEDTLAKMGEISREQLSRESETLSVYSDFIPPGILAEVRGGCL